MKRQNKKPKDGRWVRDEVKEKYWRQQLALWQQSGLSIRAFCKEHGVVETSFYAWRRELIIRARETGASEEIIDEKQAPPNVLKDGRGRSIAIRYRQSDQPAMQSLLAEKASGNPFIPLHVVDRSVAGGNGEAVPDKEEHCATGLEIALPGGAVIRLNDNSNVQLVAELLSALKG